MTTQTQQPVSIMERQPVMMLPVMHAIHDPQQREACYIRYIRKSDGFGNHYYIKEEVTHDDCSIQRERRYMLPR